MVVPEGVDCPARPSGGNLYDRRMCKELAGVGWTVVEHPVPGAWPEPDASCARTLSAVLSGLPSGATVLLDGLLAPAIAGMAALADRLALVVLVHMAPHPGTHAGTQPGNDGGAPGSAPGAALAAATAVVATSPWTKTFLVETLGMAGEGIDVVEPGVDPAPARRGSAGGGRLLCVAAVTAAKGHDILLVALASLAALDWDCTCAGALDLDPAFTAGLLRDAGSGGIGPRVHFTGPVTGAGLDALYASADVLVLPTRQESYGMVITEALARGIPVIASEVGGVPATMGRGDCGTVPGLLVPPADPHALAGALRAWLGDAQLRRRLRSAALERRASLRLNGWAAAAGRLSTVLAGVARDGAAGDGGARGRAARDDEARGAVARGGV